MDLARLKSDAEKREGTAPSGGAPVRDAETVIASLRPRFKACYQEGLRTDPSMQGCVVLRTSIDPSGYVQKNEVFVREDLSEPVVDCIRGVVRSAKFFPPGGRGSLLQIPVTFVPTDKP